MTKEVLDEREFELVNIIGAELGSNQRDLSRHMERSLGMVNMLIRRLISKGYIRINQLNKRKVQYILTPKGFTEKMRKSVKYTLKTINSISVIKECLKNKLYPLTQEGEKRFVILGESDFAILVEMVLRELCVEDYSVRHIQSIEELSDEVLLICREEQDSGMFNGIPKSINLVEELAKNYVVEKDRETRKL